jgi:hypothetical protein
MRHLRHQGFRQAQQPAAAVRRLEPRQRHLRPHAPAQLILRDPRFSLSAALQPIKCDNCMGLQSCSRRLQIL